MSGQARTPVPRQSRVTVQDVVQDLLSKVGHPDFIDVGKDQGDPSLDPGRVLADGVPFPSDVPPGFSTLSRTASKLAFELIFLP